MLILLCISNKMPHHTTLHINLGIKFSGMYITIIRSKGVWNCMRFYGLGATAPCNLCIFATIALFDVFLFHLSKDQILINQGGKLAEL